MTSLKIGFGSIEQAFEDQERIAFEEYVSRRYVELGLGYFTDDFIKEISDWLDAKAREFRAQSNEYETATSFPNRYSYFWPHVLGDASYVVAVFSFHHINRRHGLSPDGWALMQTKKLFHIYGLDIEYSAHLARQVA